MSITAIDLGPPVTYTLVMTRPRLLRLRAEMKVPGAAWLELRVRPRAGGGAEYRQRAVFVPHGLLGHLYWWVVAPFHGLVFGGMTRNIVRAAEDRARSRPPEGNLGERAVHG
jgi:uncharacterized protein DUF2867